MRNLFNHIVEAYKKASGRCSQDFEEDHRDKFEREAFASGDFKGVRFTRTPGGEYANARLETTWKDWIAHQRWLAMAI